MTKNVSESCVQDLHSELKTAQIPEDEFLETGGFSVDELYALSTTFLREKEGKAFHLSYGDRLRLAALSLMVAHGPYSEEKCPPPGPLDIIGRDRRQEWCTLGELGEREAKGAFVQGVASSCPLFSPFVEAHRRHLVDMRRKRLEEEERHRREKEEEEEARLDEEEARLEEEEERRREEEWLREEKKRHKKRLIQEALNRQTFHQFKSYAEKQFPGNPEQQAVLIRQLQEQHYLQYTQQVEQEEVPPTSSSPPPPLQPPSLQKEEEAPTSQEDEEDDNNNEEDAETTVGASARLWTREGAAAFRESVRAEGGDGVVSVGHGETVTVRVPTHRDGAHLFWEFATDGHDLGFGLHFEWGEEDGEQRVTVHVSDDSDEEEEEGDHLQTGKSKQLLTTNVVIPVFRRDCHLKVYCGSHAYPGTGAHLLKFDNSYSLWRSKTLYYRVYYTQ